MLRVAAYTSGENAPSARFRVRHYISPLRERDVDLREYPARWGSFPPPSKTLRPLWGLAAAGERALAAGASFFADVTLLQREMLSTLLTAEPLTRGPRALDVDDAIWLHGDGFIASRLARLCQVVICGNDFLAENFRQWNPHVVVLPTAVDTERYHPDLRAGASPLRRIGWSGQSGSFPYLNAILPGVRAVLDRRKDVVLRIVSDRRPDLEGIAADRVEFILWSSRIEVRAIQEMSIGVMPLEESAWARGKCSFKLLTYMACGIPVVASPVGMNASVLAAGGGLGPRRWEDWGDALDSLLEDRPAAARMAAQGRRTVVSSYSLHTLAPQFAAILKECGNSR